LNKAIKNIGLDTSIRYFIDSDGGALIDRQTDEIELLNKASADIINLCDGTRSKNEILQQAFANGKHKDSARRGATKWMEKSIKSGVLDYTPERRKPKHASVSELRRLASELYESDNVKGAYRLQRKLVELKPDNADDWYQYGEVAHAMGHFDVSRDAYLRYLESNPDDAEIQHLVVALDGNDTPERVPDSTVAHIFDGFADSFDTVLVDELGYQAPKLVARALKKQLPKKAQLQSVADLGCGTGLVGKEIKGLYQHLCGIDLSAQMVAKAAETGLYQELHIAELETWLEREKSRFDAILAADVLVYFGSLERLFRGVVKRLSKDGTFVFTVEKSTEEGVHLTVSGRYSHHKSYIERTAREAGLQVVKIRQVKLREEYGEHVKGHLVVLQHANQEIHS